MYLVNRYPDDVALLRSLKTKALINGGIFVVFFLWFLGILLTANGYTVTSAEGIHDLAGSHSVQISA